MKNLHFDGYSIYGQVDMGKEQINVSREDTATDSLVFLLNPINKAWKVPLGYFLVTKVSFQFDIQWLEIPPPP